MRRKREQLDLEAEIAATNAKLAVLQSSEVSSTGSRSKGAISSHLEKEKGKSEPVIVLNPLANEYQLGMVLDCLPTSPDHPIRLAGHRTQVRANVAATC